MLENKQSAVRPSVISEKQTATLLGLSRETLRRRRLKGIPPRFYKIGKRVLYDEQDVLSFMQSCLREPQEDSK